MSAGNLASIKRNDLEGESTNASVTKKQILCLRSSVDKGGDVSPLRRQRIWRSGSCFLVTRTGLTRRLEPDSSPLSSGLNAHRGCGVCSAGNNRGVPTINGAKSNGSSRRGSESGMELAVNMLRDVGRQSQGPRPKMQKHDDLAPRTRSASILRPPYGNLRQRPR